MTNLFVLLINLPPDDVSIDDIDSCEAGFFAISLILFVINFIAITLFI